MGRVNPAGLTVPGDNLIIDRAGWQCQAPDAEESGGRCRRIAGYTHRRRVEGKLKTVALCGIHYRDAGPEARA